MGRKGKSGMTSSSSAGGNYKETITVGGITYYGNGYGDFIREDGYGLSGQGERPTLDKVLGGRSVDEAAYHMIDATNYGASRYGAEEKYAQLTRVANGDASGTDYTSYDFIRREAASGAGPEYGLYNRNGKFEHWRSDKISSRITSNSYGSNSHDGLLQLQHDLGGNRVSSTINSSLQRQAARWLSENPDRSGQKGWRFNGRKWVESTRRR